MKDLLTIIIPVYNLEKYIGKCLSSLSTQLLKYPEVRVLLIDDGSKDNTHEVIEEFTKKYSNITYILKENGGVSSARNLGLDLTESKFVTFIDGDDYVTENYLDRIVPALSENLELLCFDLINVYSETLTRVRLNLKNEVISLNKHEAINKFLNFEFYDKFFSSVWNKVFRMDIIKNLNLKFNTTKNIGEDEFFLYRIL